MEAIVIALVETVSLKSYKQKKNEREIISGDTPLGFNGDFDASEFPEAGHYEKVKGKTRERERVKPELPFSPIESSSRTHRSVDKKKKRKDAIILRKKKSIFFLRIKRIFCSLNLFEYYQFIYPFFSNF